MSKGPKLRKNRVYELLEGSPFLFQSAAGPSVLAWDTTISRLKPGDVFILLSKKLSARVMLEVVAPTGEIGWIHIGDLSNLRLYV